MLDPWSVDHPDTVHVQRHRDVSVQRGSFDTRLINTNAIPFIDFGKTTLVPQSMREAMNVGVRVGLRPQRSPSAASLWRHSREFARILHRRFGLFIPEINVIPVVWRVVSLVGGNGTYTGMNSTDSSYYSLPSPCVSAPHRCEYGHCGLCTSYVCTQKAQLGHPGDHSAHNKSSRSANA